MIHGKLEQIPLAVCAAVILHRGKVLLTQRPADKRQGGFWEFPGGKLDPGESPQAALIREIKEELAIDIGVGPVLETVYHHYPWGKVLIIAYLCRWLGGRIQHLEVAAHSWVSADQFKTFEILPADQPILHKIAALHLTLGGDSPQMENSSATDKL